MIIYNGESKIIKKIVEILNNFPDCQITTPTDGDMLIYNGTSQKWENFSPPFRVVANPNGGYDVIYPN